MYQMSEFDPFTPRVQQKRETVKLLKVINWVLYFVNFKLNFNLSFKVGEIFYKLLKMMSV